MKALDKTGEWILHGRREVPLNPGNSLKRYIRPIANELNIDLGGWPDFRHTVATAMLRASRFSPRDLLVQQQKWFEFLELEAGEVNLQQTRTMLAHFVSEGVSKLARTKGRSGDALTVEM